MLNFIKNFRNDEDGAVTVDWGVLTAAIVALGLAVGSTVSTGANNLGNSVVSDMATGTSTYGQ
jgi:Flp pilus assembly pilin Flp